MWRFIIVFLLPLSTFFLIQQIDYKSDYIKKISTVRILIERNLLLLRFRNLLENDKLNLYPILWMYHQSEIKI